LEQPDRRVRGLPRLVAHHASYSVIRTAFLESRRSDPCQSTVSGARFAQRTAPAPSTSTEPSSGTTRPVPPRARPGRRRNVLGVRRAGVAVGSGQVRPDHGDRGDARRWKPAPEVTPCGDDEPGARSARIRRVSVSSRFSPPTGRPLGRTVLLLLAGFVALCAAIVAVGWLITHPLADTMRHEDSV